MVPSYTTAIWPAERIVAAMLRNSERNPAFTAIRLLNLSLK